jgi:pilus assembly protein CpaC
MMAGQTLAIAGLVQTRVEAQNRGLPVVSEVPYLGALFRRTKEQRNEIETLVLVTPQLVEAMEPDEVPECGPGMRTTSPSDCELYLKGFLEVPNPCPPCNGGSCPQHGAGSPDAARSPAPEATTQPSPSPSVYFQRQTSAAATRSGGTTGSADRGKSRAVAGNDAAGGGLPGFGGPIGYDAGN